MFQPNHNERLLGKPVQIQAIWDEQFACVRYVVGYPDDSTPMLHTDGSAFAINNAVDKVLECVAFQVATNREG